jgi:hypothetical protein
LIVSAVQKYAFFVLFCQAKTANIIPAENKAFEFFVCNFSAWWYIGSNHVFLRG